MNFIKKIILYNLCCFHTLYPNSIINDENCLVTQEDLIIFCYNDDNEIYPIEDIDTIYTIDEIQNFEHLRQEVNEPILEIEIPVAPDDIMTIHCDDEIPNVVASICEQPIDIDMAKNNSTALSINEQCTMPYNHEVINKKERKGFFHRFKKNR